jgi:prophage regulatory protein
MAPIYRIPDMKSATGRSRTGIYEDVKAGLLSSPVKLGPRAVGWPSNEVSAIVSARIAGKSAGEIRELVQRLEAARKQAA